MEVWKHPMKTFKKLSKELEERDYKREYANYHSRPDQIERRSKRNSARRIIRKKKEDEADIVGRDVHHKDNNPLNNDEKNLSVVSQRYNRREPRLRERRLKKENEANAKRKRSS